jgi:hypothetical protein
MQWEAKTPDSNGKYGAIETDDYYSGGQFSFTAYRVYVYDRNGKNICDGMQDTFEFAVEQAEEYGIPRAAWKQVD